MCIGRADCWSSNTLANWCKKLTLGKDPDVGKEEGQEKGATEDEMIGWHHQFKKHGFELTAGGSERQGRLACCNALRHSELDMAYGLKNCR